jgi:prepilin-type N-terminal cleavage/methylation domain-containing protein
MRLPIIRLRKTQNNEAGFTIPELIITLIVGAIFVTALNTIVVSQAYLAERNQGLILANAYVEGKVESLRSVGYNALADGTTDISSELPAELKSPRYASLIITSESPATKRIALTLSYNEEGKTRTYAYSTFIGELGVGQY